MALRQATIISMVMVFMLIFNSNQAVGHHIYHVGDDQGWTFMISNWPNGKKFHAGDILVFKYRPEEHNVVRVNEHDYNLCQASTHSNVRESGNDHIKLKKGFNYFICGIPGHCNAGMKIAVKAK